MTDPLHNFVISLWEELSSSDITKRYIILEPIGTTIIIYRRGIIKYYKQYEFTIMDCPEDDHKRIVIGKRMMPVVLPVSSCDYTTYYHLVRDQYMSSYIQSFFGSRKLDPWFLYTNAQKIRSSTYGSSLCDITIFTCEQ